MYKEYVCRQIENTNMRKRNQNIPNVICNDERLRSIISSILPCYPQIQKDVIAHLHKNKKDWKEFSTNHAELSEIKISSSYWSGFYIRTPKNHFIVVNGKYLKKTSSYYLTGVVSHELAHAAIESGMTVAEICHYFDADIRKKVERTIPVWKYYVSNNTDILSNEYLTDAATISRGFTYDRLIKASSLFISNGYIPRRTYSKWWRV
jgi:hypothetical protein